MASRTGQPSTEQPETDESGPSTAHHKKDTQLLNSQQDSDKPANCQKQFQLQFLSV